MKKNLVKNLKTENFSVSIGRAIDSINRKFGKIRFLKNKDFNAKTPQSTQFYE